MWLKLAYSVKKSLTSPSLAVLTNFLRIPSHNSHSVPNRNDYICPELAYKYIDYRRCYEEIPLRFQHIPDIVEVGGVTADIDEDGKHQRNCSISRSKDGRW
jgi:hypothetical protein